MGCSAAFSPDGNVIVTASYDNTVKIWDALTGECLQTLEGHTERVDSVVFSPDGKKIVTASADKTAKIWDVSTGQCLHTLEGHTDWVSSAAFSPDGTVIVTASADRTAKIWNALTGECLYTLAGHADAGLVSSIFSRWEQNSYRILGQYCKNMGCLNGRIFAYFSESTATIWLFQRCFHPDGNDIVTASDDVLQKYGNCSQRIILTKHYLHDCLHGLNERTCCSMASRMGKKRDEYLYAEDQASLRKSYPAQTQIGLCKKNSMASRIIDNA